MSKRRRHHNSTVSKRKALCRSDQLGQFTAQMSPADRRNLRACADAELRGDPVQALHHYQQVEQFVDSFHANPLRLSRATPPELPALAA